MYVTLCVYFVQVLHELYPFCKGNGDQNVFLLHIWLKICCGPGQLLLSQGAVSRMQDVAEAAASLLLMLFLVDRLPWQWPEHTTNAQSVGERYQIGILCHLLQQF